jgi:DNA-binding NarL/FixJ family response regulator
MPKPVRVRRPRPGAVTHRQERQIAERLDQGLTYAAIARELAASGVTRAIVDHTARRLRVRRAPGRPRATAPHLIPARTSPPSRW